MITITRKTIEKTLETTDIDGNPLVIGRAYTDGSRRIIISSEEIYEGGADEPCATITHNLGRILVECQYRRVGVKKLPVYNSELIPAG
ncbi:MAG: hypothetical protein AABW73_02635 [Nanoarchaeota archaeon]